MKHSLFHVCLESLPVEDGSQINKHVGCIDSPDGSQRASSCHQHCLFLLHQACPYIPLLWKIYSGNTVVISWRCKFHLWPLLGWKGLCLQNRTQNISQSTICLKYFGVINETNQNICLNRWKLVARNKTSCGALYNSAVLSALNSHLPGNS